MPRGIRRSSHIVAWRYRACDGPSSCMSLVRQGWNAGSEINYSSGHFVEGWVIEILVSFIRVYQNVIRVLETSVLSTSRTDKDHLPHYPSIQLIRTLKVITHIRKKLSVHMFIVVQIDIIPRMAKEYNEEHIVECMVFARSGKIR